MLAACLLCLPGSAAAQIPGESVVVHEAAEQDLYLFGTTVEVLAPVQGDVVAAGGEVRVNAEVHGDVNAAAGLLTLAGPVSDDVRVAGGRVRIGGRIGDDLLAAGRTLELAADTTVGGRAWLTGDRIEVDGVVEGELRASGRRVSLSGEVRGDTLIIAEELELLPGAIVRGVLRYRSPREAQIDSRAQVTRGVEREAVDRPAAPGSPETGLRLFALLSLATAGLVLFLLFPGPATTAARRIGASPWASLGLGLAVLAATPLVVVLLLISVVGVWLGFIVLALYAVAVLAGFLLGALFLGDAGLRTVGRRANPGKGGRAGALLLAVLALWSISLLPLVGGIAMFITLLFGLGALALRAHGAYAGQRD